MFNKIETILCLLFPFQMTLVRNEVQKLWYNIEFLHGWPLVFVYLILSLFLLCQIKCIILPLAPGVCIISCLNYANLKTHIRHRQQKKLIWFLILLLRDAIYHIKNHLNSHIFRQISPYDNACGIYSYNLFSHHSTVPL